MADFTITHRIEAPELTAALNNLADALKGCAMAEPAASEATIHSSPEASVQANAAAPTIAPQQIPDPVAVPIPAPVPVEAPVPTPVTKVYTFEDITTAGSQLLEMNKMPQLMELLKGYGVQAVTQLKPEQYADVAAGLRGLGANI